MNDGALKRHLREQVTWWTASDWERDDTSLRESEASGVRYEPEPLADIVPGSLYILRGPRRVGKSVEIKRAIAVLIRRGVDPRAILYCSCDGLTKHDFQRLIISGHNLVRTVAGPRYWFLDEVTAVPGWAESVKHLRDTNTDFADACVVLAGSSARDFQEATSSLAGRRGPAADSDRLLLPMSFRDFCLTVDHDTASRLPDLALRPKDFFRAESAPTLEEMSFFIEKLEMLWQIFVEVGGYPQAVSSYVRSGAVDEAFLNALLEVIRGDVMRDASLSETEALALISELAANLASPVNLSSLAERAGLRDSDRAADRINGLADNFLGWRCYREQGGVPAPKAQRKFYFMDPVLARLAHLRNPSHPEPDDSKITEQQIGLALHRAAAGSDPGLFIASQAVMYERKSSGDEIDFVGPTLGGPFEGKYVDHRWKPEAKGMLNRYGKGIMATRTAFDLAEPVQAIPAPIVAWLLG